MTLIDVFVNTHYLQNKKRKSSGGTFICQMKYIHEVLSWFGVENCNTVKNPIVLDTRLSKNDVGTKVDATKLK